METLLIDCRTELEVARSVLDPQIAGADRLLATNVSLARETATHLREADIQRRDLLIEWLAITDKLLADGYPLPPSIAAKQAELDEIDNDLATQASFRAQIAAEVAADQGVLGPSVARVQSSTSTLAASEQKLAGAVVANTPK